MQIFCSRDKLKFCWDNTSLPPSLKRSYKFLIQAIYRKTIHFNQCKFSKATDYLKVSNVLPSKLPKTMLGCEF